MRDVLSEAEPHAARMFDRHRHHSSHVYGRSANVHLGELWLAQRCADHLEEHREAILTVLTRHESHEAATEEIDGSIDTLRNLHRERAHLRRGAVESVAVFLPINLPLYSLVLFALVPSLMADRVDVRTPAATPEWLTDIAEAAQLRRFFPRVNLHVLTRRQFIENYASQAQAVIFTGRHESAEDVRAQCPKSLFIYTGSGVNPIVIGPHAELTDDVFDRLITTRVFNGGQDCAAPDAFLVHASMADEFVGSLVDRVTELPAGTYDDPSVRIGPILNPSPLKDLASWLTTVEQDVVVGGTVDRANAFVEPTVVVRPMSEHEELTEFFAPIFYVLVYDNDDELRDFFSRREYVENAMYVSLFGAEPVEGLFETSTVLFNQTVLDVEQGNSAFGGNGSKANYVALGEEVIVGPVLMSRALGHAVAVFGYASSFDWALAPAVHRPNFAVHGEHVPRLPTGRDGLPGEARGQQQPRVVPRAQGGLRAHVQGSNGAVARRA
jgi:acyl-CoA reductase-like NAD-dependent aldehyde dehydrogenase